MDEIDEFCGRIALVDRGRIVAVGTPSELKAKVAPDATTTHRGLDTPKGMPNPQLVDYQIKQVVAYILSLRK